MNRLIAFIICLAWQFAMTPAPGATIVITGPVFSPAAGGGGGIAFDAATDYTEAPASSVLTVTRAHTCTGANGALVVVFNMGGNGAATVTGVTYAGAAMTQLWQLDSSGGVEARSSGWIKIGPATGANNIVVTVSANAASYGAGLCATSWTGVDQGNTVGTSWRTPVTGGNAGGAAISLNLSGAQNGDGCVMGVCNWGIAPTTASHTSRQAQAAMSGSAYDSFVQTTTATGGTTFTFGAGEFWSGGAVALIPD